MNPDIEKIHKKIEKQSALVDKIRGEIGRVIVGQDYMIDRILIGLLTSGHVLLEGVPGLAKTMTVKTLARIIQTGFHRIQFTPDLLPADLIGTLIYNQNDGEFHTKKGPIFTNILLADEINRAPAKVQSALLEAMQEYQVTIGGESYPLPEPFLVLATQNPIEQEGTYPLPEAQVDRFMLKLTVDYPSKEEELLILRRMTREGEPEVKPTVSVEDIIKARRAVSEIYIDEKVERYIVDLVLATRQPADYGLDELAALIGWGASPRASIYLTMTSKALAFINRRGYVIPEDVRAVAPDVLRHRIIVTYEAEAEEVTSDEIVRRLLHNVEVP
jgi:MoxR-like ATPase